MRIRVLVLVICGGIACSASDDARDGVDPDPVMEDGTAVMGAGWRGEGEGWDGSNAPDGVGYELHYIQGGWVVEADLSIVDLIVPDPLTHCGSQTREWAEHAEQAQRGVFAAVNANFFECDAGATFTGRTCPAYGESVDPLGALAAEQYPIGVQCGDGNCFDNTQVSTARYMSHLVVRRSGAAEIVVYSGNGTPAGPPFSPPPAHEAPGAVADADIAFAVSGAPTFIRDGVINDKSTGWSSLYYYDSLADYGTIPFVGLSADRRTAYLGVVSGGARLAAQQLLTHFPDVQHAIAFDAGASPTFWFKGGTGAAASRKVPAKLALASPANVRTGVGRSRCHDDVDDAPDDDDDGPTPPPPGPGGPQPPPG
jgi:hypothetical protein